MKKLQAFLNGQFGTTLPVTGVYGTQTIALVKKFQVLHADAILAPWARFGLKQNVGTGQVYKTTLYFINQLLVATSTCPVPKVDAPQLP